MASRERPVCKVDNLTAICELIVQCQIQDISQIYNPVTGIVLLSLLL
jgi:hypothetical protein